MDSRLAQIENWLKHSLAVSYESIQPASEDASFRRYFRITKCSITKCSINSGQNQSFIIMDAPPAKETLDEFVIVNKMLVSHDVHAPKIIALDIENGFMLLEDLGKRTYLTELKTRPDELYTQALNSLLAIQEIPQSARDPHYREQRELNRNGKFSLAIAPYDQHLIEQEMELFITWFCERHHNYQLKDSERAVWESTKTCLVDNFQQQPQTWVHRDFHSRNLMITNTKSPGVIDFQDMVWGPIVYDLASLFKDCYIEWPRARQLLWLEQYFNKLDTSTIDIDFVFEDLVRWYDLTGLQRHIKVLGIFCRLNYRDNKSHYLKDLPLVEKYIHQALDLYPAFDQFNAMFKRLTQLKQS